MEAGRDRMNSHLRRRGSQVPKPGTWGTQDWYEIKRSQN